MDVIWTSSTAFAVDAVAAALGRKPGPDTLEVGTLACYEEGKRFTAVDLHNALALGNTVSRQVGAFFKNVNVLVTPTIPSLPPRWVSSIKIAGT